jgi:predicted nucleic acid-binding protein
MTLAIMEICSVDRAVLEVALTSGVTDFEDAVQLACANTHNLDAIVTRNAPDFLNASLPVLSVGQLLEQLE